MLSHPFCCCPKDVGVAAAAALPLRRPPPREKIDGEEAPAGTASGPKLRPMAVRDGGGVGAISYLLPLPFIAIHVFFLPLFLLLLGPSRFSFCAARRLSVFERSVVAVLARFLATLRVAARFDLFSGAGWESGACAGRSLR